MGLWTGLTASLLRQCTYGAARFGIYGWLKEEGWGGGGKRGLWVNGAVAGLVAGVVGAPAGQSELYPLFPPASSLPSPPPLVLDRNHPRPNVLRLQQNPLTPPKLPELHRRLVSDHQGRRGGQVVVERVGGDGGEERGYEC